MARGVPVVAYRTGAGSDEILEDGRTGLMADFGNARLLADHALRLTSDHTLRQTIVEAARRTVAERFDITRMTDEISQVYAQTAGLNACLSGGGVASDANGLLRVRV
jgi:glycosyltransferase involved in cell wall biosynthesis